MKKNTARQAATAPFAGAASLKQAHVQPQAGPTGLQRAPATEQQLWAYLTQLAAAIRAVHSAGLAVGPASLAPSKVLLASRATSRIRIGDLPFGLMYQC